MLENDLKIIKEEGYSRIPVYQESLDKIIGVLYTREYLLNHTNPHFKLEDAMFSPKYVPETMHLDALLKEMQDTHNHIAIVVNEYGLTSGVVSMEDIIEELVGEIWDESDEEILPIKEIGDDKYRVLSTVSLDEFFTFFELDVDEESDSTTVNGWVNERAESIPEIGFTFDYEKLPGGAMFKYKESFSSKLFLNEESNSFATSSFITSLRFIFKISPSMILTSLSIKKYG